MYSQSVYTARLGWLKCETMGKKQELEDIEKSRAHSVKTIESLDHKKAVVEYVIEKMNQEMQELQELLNKI